MAVTTTLTLFICLLSLSSVSAVRPTFLETPQTITATAGSDVILPCSIQNLGSKNEVVWKKGTSPVVVGDFVFAPDVAYVLVRKEKHLPSGNPNWDLRIRTVRYHHAGTYECEISAQEDFGRKVTLRVVGQNITSVEDKTPWSSHLTKHDKTGCPSAEWHYAPESNACYLLRDDGLKRYDEAREDCRQFGAVLAMARTANETQILSDIMDDHSTSPGPKVLLQGTWLGGTDRMEDGIWQWDDGEDIGNYTMWADNSPANNGDCIRMLASSHRWMDERCDAREINLMHICFIQRYTECPEGWIYSTAHGNSKFCYFYNTTDDSFRGAKRSCGRLGANMVMPKHPEQNEFLKNIMFSDMPFDGIWLGGQDKKNEGVWIWNDGDYFHWTNWFNGMQVLEKDSSKNCNSMRKDGTWSDLECRKSFGMRHICFITLSQGCADGWTYFPETQGCYKYRSGVKTNRYPKAQKDCANHGAVVAMARSPNEKDLLLGIRRGDNTADSIWLGAKETKKSPNNYKWVDGTRVNWYTNWKQGQPVHVKRAKSKKPHCAYMNNSDGRWSTVPCVSQKSRSYICMRENDGDCPYGWVHNNMDQRCYKVLKKKAFHFTATNQCHERGAELAMPKDAETLAFLRDNLLNMKQKRGQKGFWIGAKITPGTGVYHWGDATDFTWNNFPGHPIIVETMKVTIGQLVEFNCYHKDKPDPGHHTVKWIGILANGEQRTIAQCTDYSCGKSILGGSNVSVVEPYKALKNHDREGKSSLSYKITIEANKYYRSITCEQNSGPSKRWNIEITDNPVSLYSEHVAYYTGKKFQLTCSGGRFIMIMNAAYGNYVGSDCLASNDVTALVAMRCDGRRKCRIAVNIRKYGDPCPRKQKKLNVFYKCVTTTGAPPDCLAMDFGTNWMGVPCFNNTFLPICSKPVFKRKPPVADVLTTKTVTVGQSVEFNCYHDYFDGHHTVKWTGILANGEQRTIAECPDYSCGNSIIEGSSVSSKPPSRVFKKKDTKGVTSLRYKITMDANNYYNSITCEQNYGLSKRWNIEINGAEYLPNPLATVCPTNHPWVMNKDTQQCYLFVRTTGDFRSKVEACQKLGGYLPEPRDAVENDFIRNLMVTGDPSIGQENEWEGIFLAGCDRATQDYWRSPNSGEPVVWTNWHSDFQNSNGKQAADGCISMRKDGLWAKSDCMNTNHFRTLCVRTGYTECRPGWALYGNYCYRYNNTASTYDDSATSCRSSTPGAHLARPRGFLSNDFIDHYSWGEFTRNGSNLRLPNKIYGIWIGKIETCSENTPPENNPRCTWVDKSNDSPYTNWHPAEKRHLNCAYMEWKTGMWRTRDCAYRDAEPMLIRHMCVMPSRSSGHPNQRIYYPYDNYHNEVCNLPNPVGLRAHDGEGKPLQTVPPRPIRPPKPIRFRPGGMTSPPFIGGYDSYDG